MSYPQGEGDFPETPLTRGIQELMDAAPEYEKAENYYKGEVEEIFAHYRIARYIGHTKNRYRLNFAKMVVNTMTDRIEIASVTVPGNDTLTKLLNKIYKKNRMHRKSRTVHRRTTMFGDCYLFVWPEDPDNPTIRFEVHYNDPRTTRAIYSREHPDKIEFVIKMWREPSPLGPLTWRANLYYPEHTEKWIANISGYRTTKNAAYHEAIASSENHLLLDPDQWDLFEEPLPNPYGQIPIFHFRNDEPYGRPRHKDAYGASDAINKLSTTLIHTADFQGFPQRYGLADPSASLGGDGDNSDWDDEEDDPTSSSTNSGVESGPGTFIRLEGIKAAGSFPAAQPDAFMDPARFYLRSMGQITNTPLRFFDPIGEPPSGEALRAMDAPLNKEVLDFEDMLEETWADVYEFKLRVLKKLTPIKDRAEADPDDPDDDIQVDIQWKPVFSVDDSVGWETVLKKISAGVPPNQALMEAGYSKNQVDEWMKANENRSVLDQDSEVMSRLAGAARDLSTATAAGILDKEIAQHILTNLFQKLIHEKISEPPIKPEPILLPPQPPPPPTQPEGEEDVQRQDGRASGQGAGRPATVPDK